MSDNSNKVKAQIELNRQALVSLGRRISEVECRVIDLNVSISETKKYISSVSETAQRIGEVIRKVVDKA